MTSSITYQESRSRGRFAGAVEFDLARPLRTSKILGGKAAQTSTLTVDTAADSTAYTWTINDTSFSITSSASATTSSIAIQIRDAINQHADVAGIVRATASSAVVTITAHNKGESFTLSSSDANLTEADTTTASSGDTAYFGTALFLDPSNPTECLTADSTSVPVKVMTATPPTAANSTEYILSVTMLTGPYAGNTYTGRYTSDDNATTKEICDNLNTAINAALPAATVVVTDNDSVITLTGEVPGEDFAVGGGGGAWVFATTTAAGGRRFLGVAEHVEKNTYSQNTTGSLRYDGGDRVSLVEKGYVWVRFESTTPTLGTSPVYVRVTATGTEVVGTFRAANNDSGDCFEIPPSRARWAGASETGSDGNTIALLELL